jgi:hypothetical protein
MRLTVNDPRAIASLLAALRAGDCIADQAGPRSIDVRPQWLTDAVDAGQAPIELSFFARAWAAAHPGLVVAVAY